MTAEDISLAFAVSQSQLEHVLERVSADQAIRRPATGANTIHWIVGHLLAERVEALELMGAAIPGDWPELAMFTTGSPPVSDDMPDYGALTPLIPASFEAVAAALGQLSDVALSAVQPGTMLGKARGLEHHLLTYPLHEMYHVGQISVIRRELNP